MEFSIRYGQRDVVLRADPQRVVAARRKVYPAAINDSCEAVRVALESPVGFPPLRQALTPDDHVAIVADQSLRDLEAHLVPIVEHVCSAGVSPGRITVVLATESLDHPRSLGGVAVERHDPGHREHLAYVATTAGGRRVYLNRTVVEADQVIALAEVRHDPRGGLTGGAFSLFPALSDAATRAELREERNAKMADEANEVIWLFGIPFFLSVIAGEGGTVHDVIGGPVESLAQVRKAIKNTWVADVDRAADLVIASINGDGRASMGEFAAALTHASGVAQPGGVIVLLTDAAPDVGSGMNHVRHTESPSAARKTLDAAAHEDFKETAQWLRAVHRHRVMVLSRWDDELVEDLFATPLQNAEQTQRLIDAADNCLILPEANRLFAHIPPLASA